MLWWLRGAWRTGLSSRRATHGSGLDVGFLASRTASAASVIQLRGQLVTRTASDIDVMKKLLADIPPVLLWQHDVRRRREIIRENGIKTLSD